MTHDEYCRAQELLDAAEQELRNIQRRAETGLERLAAARATLHVQGDSAIHYMDATHTYLLLLSCDYRVDRLRSEFEDWLAPYQKTEETS